MEDKYPMEIPIEEAVAILKRQTQPVEKEAVSLEEADGRILAQDIIARENVPPFDRSPYDGYAFRAADVANASVKHPVTLAIIEEVPAGHAPSREVTEGTAVKILTGAPIPEGADAVEKFESTSFTKDSVTFCQPVQAGSNICRAGEDVSAGCRVLEAGEVVNGARMGVLAALGYSQVECYRKVRCMIVCTGSELLPVSAELLPGKIRSSSGYMLGSWLRNWGMDCDLYGIVKDDEDAIAEAITACLEDYDVVLTTGGVSVGDYDFLERSLNKINVEILFSKVQMKPGMAFVAAGHDNKLVLALSGNPSAAAASLYMVGREVLLYMAGRKDSGMGVCYLPIRDGFPKKSPGRRFLPGVLRYGDVQTCIDTGRPSGNGMVSPWMGCNAVAEIPADSPPIKPGETVKVHYLL